MSQGEISLCTPQILQNAISPSVGLLVYYCGLCQQGFTSEAEVNQHIPQHFPSVKYEPSPPTSNTPKVLPASNEPMAPSPPEVVSSEDEKEDIEPVSQTHVVEQQALPANNTYYILIPQSQIASAQPSNAIYINGSANLTDNTTQNTGAITLTMNNHGLQQPANGTTLYQIIQDPHPPERAKTPEDTELPDRRMSTSSSEYQIIENGRNNSEPQLFTLPEGNNNQVMITELPMSTSHSSQLAILPQDASDMSHPNYRMGYSSQMSGHFKKRHVCDICSRAFTQRGSLKYHRMLHTGEKPFQCNVCNKSFRIRAPYDAHMDVHNGVRYRCSICLKYYSSRATLRQHLKGQHPNMPHPPISSCGFQCSSINLPSDEVDSAIKQ